jgi:hypothetical protein
MRSREFVIEKRADEIAPVVGAVGGALARGAGNLAMKGAQALGGAVAKGVGNIAGSVANKVLGTTGTAGTGGVADVAGTGQDSPEAKKQQQLQQQQLQATSTNLDKIAAQIVALKQDILKQQQTQ